MATVRTTYDAVVTKNDDELLRGRVKVKCAGLMGDEEVELPQWIPPAVLWGWFVVPDIGEQIEIEVTEQTDVDESFQQSSIDAGDIRWKGVRHFSEEDTPIHEDLVTNYGKRRGFATPNGHILYFDDTEGQQKVQLSWKQGDNYQYLSFDENGSTILSNANGTSLYFDAENGALGLFDEHGNTISSDQDGIKAIDKFSNIIEMKDGVVQILGQGNVIVNCSNCSLKAANVDIGDGADAPVPRGTELAAWLPTHTHPAPGSPPSQPIPPTLLSTVAKVK